MSADGQAYPDTLVGTDSHTTMINGLGCLGWGVGGIEAEAAMLGQPGRHARPADQSIVAAGGRRAPERSIARRRDGDRSGVDGHPPAAPARRGRSIRGIFRPGHAGVAAGGSGHPRQHGPGVRRDLRLFPGRRRNAALPALFRPVGTTGRAGGSLLQGTRLVLDRGNPRGDLYRGAVARSRHDRAERGPRHDRAERGRPGPAAGSSPARRCESLLQGHTRRLPRPPAAFAPGESGVASAFWRLFRSFEIRRGGRAARGAARRAGG